MILLAEANHDFIGEIATQLIAAGREVRAAVITSNSSVVERVAATGAEIAVMGNFRTANLRTAMQGVDRAFLRLPNSPDILDQQRRFLRVAQESGVRYVVMLSEPAADADSPVQVARWYGQAERLLAAGETPWAVVRPAFLMQGLAAYATMIGRWGYFGAIMPPSHRFAMLDMRDAAAAIVAVLTTEGHLGRTYDLTGPELLSLTEAAAWLSAAAGREIGYRQFSVAQVTDPLRQYGLLAEWEIEAILAPFRLTTSQLTEWVAELTGQPPRHFATFAEDYRRFFGG